MTGRVATGRSLAKKAALAARLELSDDPRVDETVKAKAAWLRAEATRLSKLNRAHAR